MHYLHQGNFGSSAQVKARLIVQKLCCEEAVSCKILASTVLVGLFSWVHVVQQFLESCWSQTGELCYGLASVTLGYFRAMTIWLLQLWIVQSTQQLYKAMKSIFLPWQQHKVLASGKVFLAPLVVGSPCQCSSFILGHSFSHIKVLRKAFCLALLHLS